jgi:hypothetical protein
VYSCTHLLTPRNSPPPPSRIWTRISRALLVSKDMTTSLCNPLKPTEENLGTETLERLTVTERLVRKKIKKLETYSSSGLDGIGPQLLLELSEEVEPVLTVIYSQSLRCGVVSEDWRNSNVTPLFKKGKKGSHFDAAVLDNESVGVSPLCFIFALVFLLVLLGLIVLYLSPGLCSTGKKSSRYQINVLK